MEQEKNIYPEREPRFRALLPFVLFVVFYLGLSLWQNDFYCVPMPVAFIVASAAALLLDHKQKFMTKVEIYARGMGNSNIMIMCMIFILAGAFAATAAAMGAVDAAVLIARHLLPENLLLGGFFIVSCFISLAVGTSCGTIAALMPIAIGIAGSINCNPVMMTGAVIGGAMFGDNMSMISDTTIAATRTQGVAMRDKFLVNIKIALPAAAIVFIIYCFSGSGGGFAEDLPEVMWENIFAIIPYIAILAGALVGLNVMALLFLGIIMAAATGILSGTFTFFEALSCIGKGTLGMSETLIVAILAGGLLEIIRYNGGIKYLLAKIEKLISGSTGCEIGTALTVAVVNLFTANNTVAIVVSGPVVRDISRKYKCDPRRIASILDTVSCVVQGMIPYGAQVLISIGVANEMGLKISSLELLSWLLYPMLLAVAVTVFIGLNLFIAKK